MERSIKITLITTGPEAGRMTVWFLEKNPNSISDVATYRILNDDADIPKIARDWIVKREINDRPNLNIAA